MGTDRENTVTGTAVSARIRHRGIQNPRRYITRCRQEEDVTRGRQARGNKKNPDRFPGRGSC
ncbi:hypothetical protein Thiowin_00839 [Thiorhodovibrio winogradskyi]|uniref:Uncharacterized protein n=1 Tax=Thiorhodovibrio winogradskyi TaxID=77007 RepID=A0ABZ0S8Q7_9GAMM